MKYSSKQVVKAKIIAINAHSGQFRKINKDPYIIHILRILEHAQNEFYDYKDLNKLKICIALHDVIEDTWITEEYVLEEFGIEILNIVKALTKDKTIKQPLQEEQYREQLKKASDETKIIKLLDLYDNFHDVKNVEDKKKWQKTIKKWQENLDAIQIQDKYFKPKANKIKKYLKQHSEQLIKELNC